MRSPGSILHAVALVGLCSCTQTQSPESPKDPGQELASGRPIVVLLCEGFTALDAIGPLASLAMLEDVRIITVAKERGPVVSDNGIEITVERALHEVDSAYILLVPGGLGETLQTARDTAVQRWIQRIDAPRHGPPASAQARGSWPPVAR